MCRLTPGDVAAIPAADPSPPTRYVRLVDRPDTRELVIEVGPVDVPAGGMAAQSREISFQLVYVPFEAWVHGYRVELIDARGATVPRRLLHHIDTSRPAFRELFLPVPQRFLAAGLETQGERLPAWLVGGKLYRNEPLFVSTMLYNPTASSYSGVRVRLILPYSRSRPLFEVAGIYLDVKFPVGPKDFDLPPGRSVWTWEGSPAIPVRLIGLTGHLHKHAEWVELTDVTTGTLIWRAFPDRNDAGDVTGMPVHFFRLGLGVPLSPAHRYQITAAYTNPTGRVIPNGGMAKLGGIVLADRSSQWPRADVGDGLYQQDLRWMLARLCRTAGGAMTEPHAH